MLKIKNLSDPLDFYGKTWIVKTLSKEDLKEYFSKKEINSLDDADMARIAEKMGDAYGDGGYWEDLELCAQYVLQNK